MHRQRRITVLGLGKSAKSAIKFLRESDKDSYIFVSDIAEESKLYLQDLLEQNLISAYETGLHSDKILDADLIIASPGINTNLEIFEKAKQKNIEIISELELGFQALKTKNIIAITGTNGKTTTVNIIYQILTKFGKDVFLCGNVGTPITEIAHQTTENSFVVIEASSYQLELIEKFHPKFASVLNITPDHLYRYKNLMHYAETKYKIFENQDEKDVAILNLDDEYTKFFTSKIKAIHKTFSLAKKTADVYFSDGKIILKNKSFEFDTERLKIFGLHNIQNIMAAILCLEEIVSEDFDKLADFLENFEGLEHRLELVANINGTKFINDSKATNIDSTEVALKSFNENVILLLGGIHKGYSFENLGKLLENRVKKIVVFGEARDRIADELKKFSDTITVKTKLKDATLFAAEIAKNGDVVLLSPGCSSFDEFRNFEHRGEYFKSIVVEYSKSLN